MNYNRGDDVTMTSQLGPVDRRDDGEKEVRSEVRHDEDDQLQQGQHHVQAQDGDGARRARGEFVSIQGCPVVCSVLVRGVSSFRVMGARLCSLSSAGG